MRFSLVQETFNFFLGKVFPGVAYIFLINLASKNLGEAEYGAFSLLSASSVMAGSFAVGWFNQYQLRRAGSVLIFSPDARTRRVAIFVGCAALLGLTYSMATGRLPPLAALALAVLSYGCYLLKLVSYQSALQSASYKKFEITRAGLVLMVALSTLVWPLSGQQLLVLVSLTYLIPFRLINDKYNAPSIPLKKADMVDAFRYGWPIALWLTAMASQSVYERWLIGHAFSPQARGEYAAVQDSIVRGVAMLMLPMTMAIHAIYMRESNRGDRATANAVLNSSIKWVAILFLLAFLGWVFEAERLFFFVFAGIPVISSSLFWAIVLASIAWSCALLAHKPLERQERTGVMLMLCIACLGGAYGASFLLTAYFGVISVPICSALAASAYILFSLLLSRRGKSLSA